MYDEAINPNPRMRTPFPVRCLPLRGYKYPPTNGGTVMT